MTPQKLSYFENCLIEMQAINLGVADLCEGYHDITHIEQTKVDAVLPVGVMQQQVVDSHESREKKLLLIKRALERIEDGGFGKCLKCLKPIPNEQLELDPTISYCENCVK